MMNVESRETLIPDFPVSVLDAYRNRASFDWKRMKLFVEPPADIQIKEHFWSRLKKEPFLILQSDQMSQSQEQRLTGMQFAKWLTINFMDSKFKAMNNKEQIWYLMRMNEAISAVNPNLSVKSGLGISLFLNAIRCLGTERHQLFLDGILDGKLFCCIALTEVAHGSDTKRMQTIADYDPTTQEFIINTPDFKAAKFWPGNLGRQCTHALLFAQLVLNGVNHGLHAFVVPIRNPKNLSTYPGVIAGDVGEKAGLNGVDNGFLMFENYRIPRELLLNKAGDVTPDGEYETSFTDPNKILGATLHGLSFARIAIVLESVNDLSMAVTIAIRYAAQRKQFLNKDGQELPIIEYQLHQWRLFPYIAISYAFKIFMNWFLDQFLLCADTNGDEDNSDIPAIVSSMHAIISCVKPYLTWSARDGLQECRESCGGFGYLKCAGISNRRANNDARVTFEGDNNVLLQQTSNWLLRQYNSPDEPSNKYPLSSVLFLHNFDRIIKYTWNGSSVKDLCTYKFVMETYEWMLCYLISDTNSRWQKIENEYQDNLTARSMSQVFRAHTLSLVFAEYNVLRAFWLRCEESDSSMKPVLENLFYLISLYNLRRHIEVLYKGGYCNGGGAELTGLIQTALLDLCSQLKPSAVALVDAIAPPDFALNSVIGSSDGKLYEKLKEKVVTKQATELPPYYKDFILKANL